MKRIDLNVYDPSMGMLIDVSDELTFKQHKIPGSVNIPYEKLLLHYKELLHKGQKYYIICLKGIHSRKVVSILEFYGYDVTQVIRPEDKPL